MGEKRSPFREDRYERPYQYEERYREGQRLKRSFSVKERVLLHYCQPGAMHRCTEATNGMRQKNCHFFLPCGGRCMELRFEEFCANQILHGYLRHSFSGQHAEVLIKKKKKDIAEVNNRIAGYHVDFPLEGEETMEDINRIYRQLSDLGMTKPEFWVDDLGKSAVDYDYFNITIPDIKAGKWFPKDRSLLKDVMKYIEIKEKLGY